jgi:hypothetical protein
LDELELFKNLVAQLPALPRRRPRAVEEHRVAAAESTRLQLSIAEKASKPIQLN